MNNTLAVEPPANALRDAGVPRMALIGAFVLIGLVLLVFATHHIRCHKNGRNHRY